MSNRCKDIEAALAAARQALEEREAYRQEVKDLKDQFSEAWLASWGQEPAFRVAPDRYKPGGRA